MCEKSSKKYAHLRVPAEFYGYRTNRNTLRARFRGVTYQHIDDLDFVLRAFEGQYLSANVSSSGGCIKFSTISTSQAFSTDNGNNWLKLMNMCRPAGIVHYDGFDQMKTGI